MSITKETYGVFNPSYTLSYKHAIGGINAEQTDVIKDVEAIMNDAFRKAEEQVEYALYKKGFMTCNAYLERIDDMRQNGNELVQAYIKELDEKYKEK
jgi:hypothetical protein